MFPKRKPSVGGMDRHVKLLKAIAPLMFFSRIYGVLPVSVSKKLKVSISKLSVCSSCIITIGLFAVNGYSRWSLNRSHNVIRIATELECFVLHFLGLLYNIRPRLVCKTFRGLFLLIEGMTFKNFFRNIVILIVSLHLFHLIYLVLDNYFSPDSFDYFFFFFLLINTYFCIAIFLVNLQFDCALFCVNKVFKKLNRKFKRLELQTAESIGSNAEEDVKCLMTSFKKASGFCDLLSRCFGLPCLFTALFTLTATVLLSWEMVVQLTSFAFLNISTIVYLAFQLWATLYLCEEIAEQVWTILRK